MDYPLVNLKKQEDIFASKSFQQTSNIKKEISIDYGIDHRDIEFIFKGIQALYNLLAKDKNLTSIITFSDCLISAIERFFTLLFHISPSIIVYKAVKEKNYLNLL